MHHTSQQDLNGLSAGLDLSLSFKRIAKDRGSGGGGDKDGEEETVEILYKCVYPGRKGEKIWQFLPLPDLQQSDSAEEMIEFLASAGSGGLIRRQIANDAAGVPDSARCCSIISRLCSALKRSGISDGTKSPLLPHHDEAADNHLFLSLFINF